MDIFETYRKRLKRIGIFKSIMLAFSFAFVSVGIAAGITWIVKTSIFVTLATTLGVGITAFLIAFFLFYFKRFRPTNEMIAKKLDSLGQDERYITMYECQDDMSIMAKLQRSDAKKKISGISPKNLKFSLALPVVLILVIGFVFAAGATTGSVLYGSGIVGSSGIESETTSPSETIEKFVVTYKVYEEGTGTIEGQTTQQVEKGHYTQAVTAVPAENYRFVAWVDKDKNYLANQKNPRTEINVQEDITIYALFSEKEPNDDDTDGDNTSEGEGSEKPDKGGDGSDSESQGGDQGQQGGGISGGETGVGHENNNVIDGTQDYKDNFDRESLENELADSDLPDDLKDILGDYYGSLKP